MDPYWVGGWAEPARLAFLDDLAAGRFIVLAAPSTRRVLTLDERQFRAVRLLLSGAVELLLDARSR